MDSNSSLATLKEPLSEVGFEPTPPFGDQKSQQLRRLKYLESGALDRSAILTLTWNLATRKEPLSEVGFEPTPPFGDQKSQQLRSLATRKEPLSEVRFEPTPPIGDQKPQQLRRLKYFESGALDHSAIPTLA
ncbi:hypothetical protein QQF64_016646 [Cirrhinus molitorella]|uniref:Uncharacterized protein n=1 Tax=Cirrhinus molitorella TaxID=172907 RepID=A0ABR3LND6_9TELE